MTFDVVYKDEHVYSILVAHANSNLFFSYKLFICLFYLVSQTTGENVQLTNHFKTKFFNL